MTAPVFDSRAELPERLIEMRRDLLAAMERDGPLPGWLVHLSGIAAALDAIDHEAMDHEPQGRGDHASACLPHRATRSREGGPSR